MVFSKHDVPESPIDLGCSGQKVTSHYRVTWQDAIEAHGLALVEGDLEGILYEGGGRTVTSNVPTMIATAGSIRRL
ncbi:MAG: hypothetical protein OXF95_08405 [Rhodobacteraceae bacterium]|nr:hypothetical protein [Paracoccaceae bacterium]